MSASVEEPVIQPRLRRPLLAAWISLGLHAALIALVQVVPPPAVSLGEPVIEARLVPAHSAPPAEAAPMAETPVPDEAPDTRPLPRLVPSEPATPLATVEPEAVPPEQPAEQAAEEQPAEAAVAAAEPVADPRADQSAAGQSAPPNAADAPAPVAAITSAVDLTFYNARELDVQPRALREIVPDYPYNADRRRLSGKVRLQLKLEADGRISDIEVVSATPPGVFEASAVKAFRDARFAPAQKNGRPVRARVVIEVVYDWEGRRQ